MDQCDFSRCNDRDIFQRRIVLTLNLLFFCTILVIFVMFFLRLTLCVTTCSVSNERMAQIHMEMVKQQNASNAC